VAVASLTFLTPLGLLVALCALVPLAALELAARRSARAARRLGLEPAGRAALALPAALVGAAFGLLGLAAAQPALRTTETRAVRTQSQVVFVVDVSRSMAASASPDAPPRLDAAKAAVLRLHAAVRDVPSGLAGLTDRVLPYLLPTADSAAFDDTLRRSVAVEAPPPQRVSINATSFGALSSVARSGFFDDSTQRRTCVLVTDGESSPFSAAALSSVLGGDQGCRLVIVRIGSSSDRVYGRDGRAEGAYRPDAAAAESVARLADAVDGSAFDAGRLGAAASAVRETAEVGPTRHVGVETKTTVLSRYAAGAALVAVLALAVVRMPRRRLRPPTSPAYDPSVPRRGAAS
jgi:von Willebrand factor type A domain